jgi:hypothetical protein
MNEVGRQAGRHEDNVCTVPTLYYMYGGKAKMKVMECRESLSKPLLYFFLLTKKDGNRVRELMTDVIF